MRLEYFNGLGFLQGSLSFSLIVLINSITASSLNAQTTDLSLISQVPNSQPPNLPPQDIIPTQPFPSSPPETPSLPPLPAVDLLQSPSGISPEIPGVIPGSIFVEKFEFEGNTVFTKEELGKAISVCVSTESPEINRELPQTNRELPEINRELPQTNRELPQTNRELPQTNRELPQTNRELPQTNRELPQTNTELPKKVLGIVMATELETDKEKKCPNQSQPQPLTSITNQSFSLAQLYQITTAVRKLYQDKGYSTSGAVINLSEAMLPAAKVVVTIKVVEGKLDRVEVLYCQKRDPDSNSPEDCDDKNGRLHPNYVRSRLGVRESEPLNVDHLKESLQLLTLDPLIDKVSATLSDAPDSSQASNTGKSILQVEVTEANSFHSQLITNNGRSPSVGSFQRQVILTEANLLGLGDSLSVGYSNTDGSNNWDARYTLPINSHNGTLRFAYSKTNSGVIEPPFNDLDKNGSSPDIKSAAQSYELTLRQPISQRIKGNTFQEFALGLTASWRESKSSLLDIPFPLSPGADDDGRTRISVLRFFQEWTRQNPREVIAFRSEFNLGLDAFNSTINNPIAAVNEVVPDSRFFSWQGQAQWVHLLADDSLFLVRANIQLADRPLVPMEQFGIGGFGSVRGYRQDTLLTDSGILASAEIRLPVLRVFQGKGVLQLIPFVDFGMGWNNSNQPQPTPNTLASVGMGLQWQQGKHFTARLDWGIPLISVDGRDRTWQENGLYFSVQYNPF